MVCEVEGGAGAALTDTAPGWWRHQHQLAAIKVSAPPEQLLGMVSGEMFTDAAGAGQRLAAQLAVQVSTGGDQTQAEENSRAMRQIMIQL